MTDLELWLNVALLTGFLFGCCGIFGVRACQCKYRVLCGRICYVAALVFLGASSGLAAFHRAETLVPLGLTCSFLVVGMVWDGPAPVLERRASVLDH